MAAIQGNTQNGHFMTPDPTAGDVMTALKQYFGAPAQPGLEKNYSDQNAATYNFPEAYIGKSTQLQETINSLVYQPQKWQTTIALPLRQVQGTHVEWNEIKFNEAPLGRTPYQGTSRLLTASKRKYQDRLVWRTHTTLAIPHPTPHQSHHLNPYDTPYMTHLIRFDSF